MNRSSVEPGLLRVFRWYAGVRLVLFLLAGIRFILGSGSFRGFGFNIFPYLWLALLGMALLLGYLSWPWLQIRMDRAYLPFGIILASTALILERVFTPSFAILLWQPDPFLYVLLILVAWQYDFRAVLLFTFGTTGLEIALSVFIPQQITSVELPGVISDRLLLFGFLITRTISFLIIGFIITRLMTAQRKQRRALAEANRNLVQYAATVEQLTTSRERNRLSRELHDTLAHTLSALVVQIDAVIAVWEPIPAKAKEMLEQMLETSRRGLDETRRALRDLRAAPLEELGFALAIRSMAEDFAARHGISLEVDVPEEINRLSPEIEHGFYRVTQEALENVLQHAGAQQVQVKLEREDGALILIVADNGRGFEADSLASERQLGLQGMYERAEMIGASLDVNSEMGRGTIVRLSKEEDSDPGFSL